MKRGSRVVAWGALPGIFLVACGTACGIATSDDAVSAAAPSGSGYSVNWQFVYNYRNASAVAVDHYWLLTAAHVADDEGNGSLLIDGVTYTQREIVYHDTADLALVRFDKPFPGYYPLHEGEIHNGRNGPMRVWDPLVVVGYGYPGSVMTDSFTQSGTSGIRRWGTNRGIAESVVEFEDGGSIGARSTQCFQTAFTLGDTPYEAGGNVYDSGGPLFIERDAEWRLAGIMLYRDGDGPYSGNRAALMPDYAGWIRSVIVDYDTDMDGLPDWWEQLHGGDAVSMEAGDDPDADGFDNYMEWIADSVPTNGASYFRIDVYSNATQLAFSSSSNREYQIEFRAALADTNESWQAETDWFAGTASWTGHAVSGASSNRFFRVRARLP